MISAILLAAGQSKRMLNENKLLKKINGVPLVKLCADNILASFIDELIVVTGFQKEKIEKNINKSIKIKFVYNSNFKTGIASSIKSGISSLSNKTEAFFICLGDMPMIDKDIFNLLIKYRNKNKIIVPTFNSNPRNPVLFSITLKKNIMKVDGDQGAKEVLKINKDKIFNVEINNENVFKDFDNTKDFIF